MKRHLRVCPACGPAVDVTRREFLVASGAAALSAGIAPRLLRADDATSASAPETAVQALYETLTPGQREKICHAWDFQHPERGLLRTFISNNWSINDVAIDSDFYNADQKALIRQVYEGVIHPDWHQRIDKQLEDDAGGYGSGQSIALFGTPGQDKFQFVMTGRHLTLRCDGNTAEHVAFGGPIFYGHAASGFNESADHPGNVFWPQAQAANKVFEMLDGGQRERALVAEQPAESAVGFRGPDGMFPGIPLSELSSDQFAQVQETLNLLLGHYRTVDQDESLACLQAQGGLEKCSLAFYRDGDIGNDGVWDCWRLEGPSFVWYFRGEPHVHVWVNVADDASVALNS
jgi:hypothetical protein